METLNLPLKLMVPNLEEKSIRDPDPKKRAEKIARAKAESIAANPDDVIIAADTYVVHEGKILEKPVSLGEAKQMLRALSGNRAVTYTGFCYLDRKNGIDFSTTTETAFVFRKLAEEEIAAYVAKFPATSWSAAFSPAYPYGLGLVTWVEGSLTSFTHGLPMELVITYLQKSGFKIAPK